MQVEEYFRDKGCVVTGAASGIGFALTEALLQAGAVVFMADRDTQTLASAVEQLSTYATRVHSMAVDVTNQEQVQHMVEEAASRHGRLDVLFNNAGMGGTAPIDAVTLEHWRLIIDINLWGVIYGTHFALPIMRRQGEATSLTPHPWPGLSHRHSKLYTAPPSMRWSVSVKACVSSWGTRASISPLCAPEMSPHVSLEKRSPRKTQYPQRRPRRSPLRVSPRNRAS